VVIIETPIFTNRVQALLSEEQYRLFQACLLNNPEAGKVIPGSGGLRKLRWTAKGHGKEAPIRKTKGMI
jgi:hypothetical protein